MSKSKKPKPKPPKKPNKSGHSTLADHRRQGKVFTSPMNTLPTTSVPWLRDVFPSLLWSCAVLTEHGLAHGSDLIGRVLDRLAPFVDYEAPEGDEPAVGVVLDGTLQGFEAITEDRRAHALAALAEDGLYEAAFPWLLVRALSKYENLPGGWILNGWEGNEQIVPTDAPGAFMAQVVIDSWHGQSEVATRAKMLYSRAYMYAGRVHFNEQIDFIRLLPDYPNGLTDDERSIVDSSMRAMFGAMWGFRSEDSQADPKAWAANFWRQNWNLYDCVTHDPITEDAEPQGDPEGANAQPPWRQAQEGWERQLASIEERFYAAHSSADPDLYAPDRNEVLTGITSRHLRSAQAMIRYPGLWSAEHGAGIIRSLVEGRIVQKWLIHKNDTDLFTKFKEYGRGHLKLHVLHLREYHESLNEPVEGLQDTITSMEDLLNRDLMEEFQDISVEGSFTKTNTRDMAYAVGLIRDYRLVFAPMSANVHSEWIALEQYALVPCGNPLHRGHRIPNKDVRILIGAEVVDLALNILDGMIEDYAQGI